MAGTDLTNPLNFRDAPRVVLIKAQMGENIGACARAMANFGLHQMRLVAPRDGWPNDSARAMASRADHVLDNAKVYPATADALSDIQYTYATTARQRDMSKPVFTPNEAATDMHRRVAAGQSCAILFGGERAGLDNNDVVTANAIIHIPADPTFSSLNLAQAVLLVGYEWFQQLAGAGDLIRPGIKSPPAKAADIAFFFERLEDELTKGGFLYPPEKKPAMVRSLRNIFQRVGLTDQDVRTLQGVISGLIRHRGEKS